MLDTESHEEPRVNLSLDEHAVRTLQSAILFTLDKWAGQEVLDQQELINLKHFFSAAVLEFQFMK